MSTRPKECLADEGREEKKNKDNPAGSTSFIAERKTIAMAISLPVESESEDTGGRCYYLGQLSAMHCRAHRPTPAVVQVRFCALFFFCMLRFWTRPLRPALTSFTRAMSQSTVEFVSIHRAILSAEFAPQASAPSPTSFRIRNTRHFHFSSPVTLIGTNKHNGISE